MFGLSVIRGNYNLSRICFCCISVVMMFLHEFQVASNLKHVVHNFLKGMNYFQSFWSIYMALFVLCKSCLKWRLKDAYLSLSLSFLRHAMEKFFHDRH